MIFPACSFFPPRIIATASTTSNVRARCSLFMNENGAGRLRPPIAHRSRARSCDIKDDSRWNDALFAGECFARESKYRAKQLLTLLDELEDHVVLFLSFHRDEVHAILPANVPTV